MKRNTFFLSITKNNERNLQTQPKYIDQKIFKIIKKIYFCDLNCFYHTRNSWKMSVVQLTFSLKVKLLRHLIHTHLWCYNSGYTTLYSHRSHND